MLANDLAVYLNGCRLVGYRWWPERIVETQVRDDFIWATIRGGLRLKFARVIRKDAVIVMERRFLGLVVNVWSFVLTDEIRPEDVVEVEK